MAGKKESTSGNERKRKIEIINLENIEKKARVTWTEELNQKFLDAIQQLGHDKAVPKKIVELMNVPWLTRENVASHLQKHRSSLKRAEEGFTASSLDFANHLGFNTSEGSFLQPHLNPFHKSCFGLNGYGSKMGMPPDRSFQDTFQLKPDHNFRVYGDEKKSVLLSIKGSSAPSDTSFPGFRLSHDQMSIEFGRSSDLGQIASVNETNIHCPSASSIQQHLSLSKMENHDPSCCPSFPFSFTPLQSSAAPPGTGWGEPVGFSSKQLQQSSIKTLLDVDKSMPTSLTQQAPVAQSAIDWDERADFTQLQPCVGSDWVEPGGLELTCLQQSFMKETASFTYHQQQQASRASLLDVYQDKSVIMGEQQPPAALPGSDWNEASIFNEQQSFVAPAPPWTNWDESEQQQSSIISLQVVDHQDIIQLQPTASVPGSEWAEPASFSPRQPAPGNSNSEIFSSSSLPSEICQLGMADDNGVDTTAICNIFDNLNFDVEDLI